MTGAHRNPERRSVFYLTSNLDGSCYRDSELQSKEISSVKNKSLRLALELADVAQALDFEYPPFGGFPGKVKLVNFDSNQPETVYSSFPDDTLDRFRDFLDENN